MNQNKSIENKVDQAMGSIDGITAVSAPLYLYQKILSRLEKPKETLVDKWNSFLLTPSIAFATLCLILLLNAFVVIRNLNNPKPNTDQNTIALTDEYNQSATPSYYLENPKP